MIALAVDEKVADPADLDVDHPYLRFVSSAVIGPRAIKRLSQMEPLSLAPGTERNEYESLPKRDD